MVNTNQQLGKIPPQNIEAEQSVLGALLIDKNATIKIADSLKPEDFYKDTHAMIYKTMLEIYERKEPIDLLSLTNRLEEKNQLKTVGGRSYLTTLSNAVPTASSIVSYAGIVQKKATLRRLLHAASEIAKLGYDEEEKIEQVLDQSEQALFSVSQKHLKKNFIPIKEVLSGAFDRIDELHQHAGKLRGIPTGFHDLDNILAGLQKSDLVILAARPSAGKTSLALDIARQVAVGLKIPVGFFSLEMSKEQLVDRLLCAQANINLWQMRTGKLSTSGNSNDFEKIGYAMGQLSEAPIFIDDTAMTNVMEMRTKARRLQTEHGLGLIIIDYLQLMEGSKTESRVQEVAEITRALKGLARELNIPILSLSQLSRAVEQRQPPIPKLSDLRESGSIEQDADVVMCIYREEMYNKETQRPHIAEVHIAKHRNGPTGQISLYFEEHLASFRNLEKIQQE